MNEQKPCLAVIIPAAGIGTRMKSVCPKQYLLIDGKPIIEHTLSVLLKHPLVKQIVVVLHPQDSMFLSLDIANDPRIHCVIGGETRADSVMAGLQAVTEYDWILVHDAARPCLHYDDLANLIQQVLMYNQGGILAAPVRDTMKQAMVNQSIIAHTVDRSHLWHALTPQMFPKELLIACLERAMSDQITITDEASALEHCGYHPLLVPGRADNIKVTQPEDLALATYYLTC